jgi:uncharacterized protein (TIGR03435 family)
MPSVATRYAVWGKYFFMIDRRVRPLFLLAGDVLAVAGWLFFATFGRAQSFDVASIKPSTVWKAGGEGSSSRSQIEHSADSLTMRNIDLNEMVQWAFGLQPYEISGQSKLGDKRYDVRAKSAVPVSVSQIKVMLQGLLATRFKLTVHHEPKKTSVFELVVAKGGAKLPPNKADQLPTSSARENLPRVVDGGFIFANTSMTEFAEQLSQLRPIGLPVLDRTGIKGVYDITLKSAASAILQADGPSLFTLIQEQLGLKLIAAKDVIPILIVDHAEEPSEN